ncbi:hypothetical protein EMQ25_00375 [Arsenicitalea aurantiaca]|uniref:Uncharacterized protein n=1 Tax=Arsenicitalea aurantiaca TaxID=1783274 RepID=A0A433XKB3_9HYPH|nr:hypothetical protein [Arsenicitalea aurantiaca]RUT34454.1 hypothetical protein EMQ25_00375 [Arsenicitalea aurantiaca]
MASDITERTYRWGRRSVPEEIDVAVDERPGFGKAELDIEIGRHGDPEGRAPAGRDVEDAGGELTVLLDAS